MTTRTISSYISGGYVLATQFNTLDITSKGSIIGGGGVELNHEATLNNAGVISAGANENGVTATSSSRVSSVTVNNNGTITGYNGVVSHDTTTAVVNSSDISGIGNKGTYTFQYGDGIHLAFSGRVQNDINGTISGKYNGVFVGGTATITNYGHISGYFGDGVALAGGGVVNNYNNITDKYGDGVKLSQSGIVFNAASGSIFAGDAGVRIDGAGGQVSNDGRINGLTGIILQGGGSVSNLQDGSISGAVGVYADGPATLTNAGQVYAYAGSAVDLRTGGTVVNGGTILTYGGFGITMSDAGVVTNGATDNVAALIYSAVYLQASGDVNNFGTIVSTSQAEHQCGVYVSTGSVTNGASGDNLALIYGFAGGVRTGADSTVTNFGTIRGLAAAAVQLGPSSTLVVEADCAFINQVLGDGGTLSLASGKGVLHLSSADMEAVSGSMALTTFSNFAVVEIAASATFSTHGKVQISADQSVIDSGLLVLGDKKHAIANSGTIGVAGGTLTVGGNVNGRGIAEIGAGLLYVTLKFAEDVYFIGAGGTLKLGNSQTFTGTINGFSQAGGTVIDFSDIGFTGSSEASYSGNKNGGVLTVSNGTITAQVNLNGNYLGVMFAASADGIGGIDIIAEESQTMVPPHAFIAAMAALGQGGTSLEHTSLRDFGAPSLWLTPRLQIA